MATGWSAILWAGFVATTLAAAALRLFRSFGWTEFSPAAQVGCFFVNNPRIPLAESLGLLVLFLVGTSLLAWLYAAVMRGMGGPSLGSGALLGVVQGVAVVALLPSLGKVSACVKNGSVPAPGRLGLEWGRGTPAGIVLGHLVYGAALGATLAAFAAPPL
ncbi:MAG: hypothetical protein JO040_01535 [Gemmatimonadetes bacterium]|nr:hypothetical protein [Gemmatimonadota bacterium]